jgi:hypothetical protein
MTWLSTYQRDVGPTVISAATEGVHRAVTAFAAGRMVVVVDDADREEKAI